jgi:PAS domain S-box-containing protein
MDYENKSKEELINELKELKHNYNSLKKLYDADIAERKQIEEKLRVNEERLRLTLNVTQIGTWDWDLKNDAWYTSPIYYTMLGYEPVYHESDRDIWLERIHPEDRKTVSEKINKVLRRKSNEYSYEARMKHANGTYRWHSVVGHVIEWENNKPTRLIGVRIDITERKESEEDLRQRTALFEALLNTTIDGILIVDKQGKKVFQNQRVVELFNIPQNLTNSIDVQFQYVISTTKNSEQFAQKVFYLINHPEETSEDEVELKSGKILYRYSAPVFGKDMRNYGRIWIFRDITESKQAEKALIIAKEKAVESDRLKTAFLQNMSHEIRTPMNAIMGFSDLLIANYGNKAKLEKFSEIIAQRCNDLLEIIDDILDIAKIESGQLYINNEECNLNELFAELSTFFVEYRNRIGKKQIKFNLQAFCDPSDNIIVTDKIKLKQIFINLISNAFKFTNEGKIEGGCRLDKNNNLLFFVSDTGLGIPADKQEFIFERFAQLHQVSQRNVRGTGLGLSIVKGLVNLLGGEIFLESEPGKGSTFSFSFPYKITLRSQHVSKEIKEFSDKVLINKKILIVEDDFYNSEYLKEILSGIGINVLQAEDGKGAIEMALSQPIDLILMDIRLPDMNGYEASLQIQQHKPHLKIIAQTAYAAQEEKQKALDAGCCDYISKPTRQDALLSMLNKHLL